MFHSNIGVPAFVYALVLTVAALPAYSHDGHGAHEHGIGELDIAIEGDIVELELTSPGINLLGFEHPPRDAEEQETLDKAVRSLKDGTTLIAFGEAGCELVKSSIQSPLLKKGGPAGRPSDEDSDENDHDEHADFSVSWSVKCAKPASLNGLNASAFFARFPGTEKLRLKAVTSKGQTSGELTAGTPKFRF
jgi:hypothetical protein